MRCGQRGSCIHLRGGVGVRRDINNTFLIGGLLLCWHSFLAGESVLFPVDMAFSCVTILLLIMQSCAIYMYNARKMQKSEYS